MGAGAGAVIPPLAAVAVWVIGWQTPGYDPVRRTVSRLTDPTLPHSLAAKLTLAALGFSLLAMAWSLDRRLRPGTQLSAFPLALAGAALLGLALVGRDPTHTATLVTHRLIAIVLFCALTVAPFTVSARLREDPAFRAYATLSVATAGISLALLGIAVAGVIIGGLPSGAWERTFVGLNLLWVMLLALRLLRT